MGAAGGTAAAGALGAAGSPGEQLSRRCVMLLKAALKPDVWPHHCEPKLAWLDKVIVSCLILTFMARVQSNLSKRTLL